MASRSNDKGGGRESSLFTLFREFASRFEVALPAADALARIDDVSTHLPLPWWRLWRWSLTTIDGDRVVVSFGLWFQFTGTISEEDGRSILEGTCAATPGHRRLIYCWFSILGLMTAWAVAMGIDAAAPWFAILALVVFGAFAALAVYLVRMEQRSLHSTLHTGISRALERSST